jgi:hypothetical protein
MVYLRADTSGDQENVMVSVITSIQLQNLRREAKKRSRASENLSHWAALDQIATEHGYANWSLFAKAVNALSKASTPSIPSIIREHTIRVSGWVRSKDLVRRIEHFWHHYLPAKYPAAHYAKFKRIPDNWDVVRDSTESAVVGIEAVQRAIAFMDATDLRTSTALRSLFRETSDTVGLDHFCVWRDHENRYVISNEPYRASDKRLVAKKWCESNGWTYREMPQSIGMHNPCTENCNEDCGAHTALILMSPQKKGADLTAIGDALIKNFHKLNSTKIEVPLKTFK